MTTLSKVFAERAVNLTCKDLTHPDFKSCSSFFWFFLRSSTVQTLKYLGPIFLIPLAVNIRNTTFNDWKENAETYLKMSLGISGTVSLAYGIHCFLNKIYKEIKFINMSVMPMLIALVTFLNYLPPKFANTQFLFINNLLVQTILRTSDYQPFNSVRDSRIISTILFMTFSSLIMGLKSLIKDKNHRYWYAQNFEMVKFQTNSEHVMDDKIDHLKGLIKKQIMSTLKLGLLMSSIKIISKSVQLLRKSLFDFVLTFIQNFDYKLLGFFVTYGTSFQVINFLLNERITSRKSHHQKFFVAGFLAGSAFYLSPRYFLFTYALTTLIELLMLFFLNKMDQNSKIARFLTNIPWLKIFLCIALPTFSHWRVISPWHIPKLMEEFMRVFGNDRLAIASQNFAKYILRI